ncbi:hypothetical protein [Nostoc sp.]|uniref:hypothetical protein n=1 Tax=Nostoc sp. TaxID=1180 RepID=UPI002FF8C848
MTSAYIMGAEKAINSDRFPQRLEMAKKFAKAEVINYKKLNAGETLEDYRTYALTKWQKSGLIKSIIH